MSNGKNNHHPKKNRMMQEIEDYVPRTLHNELQKEEILSALEILEAVRDATSSRRRRRTRNWD